MKFVSFQFCNCKNTCGRRSGRKKRGCPCRDEGLKCADDCTCGTKKAACNNKQETVAVSVAVTSAFERHQIAVDEAEGHITVGVFFGSFYLPVVCQSILYCCESACRVPDFQTVIILALFSNMVSSTL